MKECPSFKVSVGFPVFGLGFTTNNELIVAGGGGAGRSGVKNKLVKYTIDVRRNDFEEDAMYEISSEEDAPMSLAVHPKTNAVVAGINASQTSMAEGINNNCRLFDTDEIEFTLVKSVQSLKSKSPEDFQKAARFSKDGSLVATGTTDGMVHVFEYPSMTTLTSVQVVEGDDVLDVDINADSTKLTAVTPQALKLINLRGRHAGEIIQSVSSAVIDKKSKLQFRGFRYGTGYSENLAFAIVNGVGKIGQICLLDPHTLEIKKTLMVSKKPVTAFCLSMDGSLVAVATADLSVSLYEATSLQLLTHIKNAHSFSITSLAISPSRRMLVSASADNTCRVTDLPLQFPANTLNPLYTIILAIFVAVGIIFATQYFQMDDILEEFLRPSGEAIATATSSPAAATAPASAFDAATSVVEAASVTVKVATSVANTITEEATTLAKIVAEEAATFTTAFTEEATSLTSAAADQAVTFSSTMTEKATSIASSIIEEATALASALKDEL